MTIDVKAIESENHHFVNFNETSRGRNFNEYEHFLVKCWETEPIMLGISSQITC